MSNTEKAIDGGLTISQTGEFIRWMQTHTALGRLQFDECSKAFEAAQAAGLRHHEAGARGVIVPGATPIGDGYKPPEPAPAEQPDKPQPEKKGD